jgi:hypothetical protein
MERNFISLFLYGSQADSPPVVGHLISFDGPTLINLDWFGTV